MLTVSWPPAEAIANGAKMSVMKPEPAITFLFKDLLVMRPAAFSSQPAGRKRLDVHQQITQFAQSLRRLAADRIKMSLVMMSFLECVAQVQQDGPELRS